MYYETPDFRVVHATWNNDAIDYLKENTNQGILSEKQYHLLADKNSQLFKVVEITCKGEEVELPDDQSFLDKDGTKRHHIRTKWWLDPKKYGVKDLSILEDIAISEDEYLKGKISFYGENEKPVFFGHYWLKGEPQLYRNNICCLDYSIAKGGILCAYRYNGESRLTNENLIYV